MYNEFDPISKKEWLDKVESDLKGKSIEALDSSFEGIDLSPFHHSDDLTSKHFPISISKESNSWLVNQIISNPNPNEANKEALASLKQGCTSLSFIINDDNGFDFNKALKDIHLEWIFTEFQLIGMDSLVFTEKLLTYAEGRGFDLDKISGAIYEQKMIKDIDIIEVRRGLFPQIRLVKIAASYEDSTVNELSSMLVKTRNQLKRHSDKKSIAESLFFEINISDSYLGNIAKVRSLRILLQNVFMAYGLNDVNTFIAAYVNTDDNEKGENYNIIRANAQALSAVIGGVELLKTNNSNHSKGMNFSNRINQNISHLLQLESHMNRVNDPASGSYFLENLTNSICETVWSDFQKR